MLCDVVIVGRTHLQSVLLAMLTMKKELHGFLFLCVIHVWGYTEILPRSIIQGASSIEQH